MKFLLSFLTLLILAIPVTSQTVITAGNDTTICLGGTASLTGRVLSGSYGTLSYTFEVIPYQPEPFTGGTPVQFAGNQDDQIAGPFDIGFSFCFFNQIYTQFYIGSNGWVGFSYDVQWTTFTAQPIPTTSPIVPKNCIMAPWQDWWPGWTPFGTGGTNVYYYLTGTAPNRKLVVYWINCPLYNCKEDNTKRGTFQIVLNEQNSIVENHIQDKPNCSNSENATQGVHNADGTVGFTATGRNCTPWTTTNESTRFVPSGIRWYTGGYPGGTIVGYGPYLDISPTVTTTYTVVVESCTGGAAQDDVTVTVVDATFNYPQATYCASDPDPVPTLLQNGGTFSATPAGLSFIDTGTGEIDLTASTPGTYLITRTINTPCTVSYSQSITIWASPQVPVPVDDTVERCGPGPVTLEVVPNAGEDYAWFDQPTGGTKLFQGTSYTKNLSATTTFFVESQTIASNCISLSRTPITAVIKPVPLITNTITAFTQCSGVSTNIVLTADQPGATFDWTATPGSPAVSGYSDGSGGTISDLLINSGSVPVTVTYHVIPSLAGCDGNTVDFTVTVNPVPDLSNTPLSTSQCNHLPTNITLTSNVAGALFTWTCTASSGNITGWSDNTVPTATLNQTLDNSGYNDEWVIYQVIPEANGCPGIPTNYTVTVYPTPNLSTSPLSKSQCDNQNTNILLTSNITGTLFTWTCTTSSGNITGWSDNSVPTLALDQTLDNTGFTTEWVTYHVTPAANGCTGTPTSYTVTVFPTPDLSNAPLSQSQCDNLPTNITLSSNVTGTLFTWSCVPSSANITGWAANVLPATLLNQTLDNTGSNTEWVTYQVTPAANGCNGTITDFTVTVYPTATVTNSPLSKNQCDNQNTNIPLTSDVAGTLFTWTCTASSGNITGWSDNSVPTLTLDQILDNTGFNTEWVTYQLTPAANGCTGTTASYTVTVFPTPDLSNSPASKSQCDSQNTNITLTSNVSGTLFTWTCTASSGNITGWSDNPVPTLTLDQTLDNTGFNTEWVTYQVTPAANGCAGTVQPYTVTVFPTPDLSNTPLSTQICNNTATNLTLTSNVAGTLFTWTCTPSSANVSGYSDNLVPSVFLNQTLVNSGLNPEWVIYHLSPSANGCDGPATDYTVNVVQTPDLLFSPPAQTMCSQQTSAINLLSSVPGTTFNWTAAASSPNLSGMSDGSGNLIAQTITNSGATIETVTYQATPSVFGCSPGASQSVILTVNPLPAVTNAITSYQICSASATNILLSSNVPGSAYSWTASGSSGNVSGYANGTGLSIVQTLTNAGFIPEQVQYQVAATANGCTGAVTPFTVTVFPVPDVNFTPNGQSFCSGNTTSIGLGSNVAGATFTWTAAGSGPSLSGYAPGSGNMIQQTLFNSGPYPEWATYLVNPTANGCPGTAGNVIVTVNPLPVVTVTPCFDPLVSVNSQPLTLKSGIPPGGAWSGPGVSAGMFYPGFAGAGTHTLNYSYTNTWGCIAGGNTSITVIILAPFTCGNALVDVRDNQSYPTVLIGGQCWFAANLNYGTEIPSAQLQRDNCISEKYCYGDNPANCISIGGMYQWDELMGYASVSGAQGTCPPEWHVPTESDWNTLFNFYTSNGFAGSPLKYTGFSGFNALLSGTRFNNVQWDFNNFAVMYWSSGSHTAKKAWAHGMNTFNPSVSFYPSFRNNAFFVRCLKD